jgi:hypothetical protein
LVAGGVVPERSLSLVLQDGKVSSPRRVVVRHAVVAGWTGRDPVAVEKHIAELEAIGVKRPASTPIFYRVGAARLTTDEAIEATGAQSSGEVEFVILQAEGRLWVGVGSDHTDREVETYGVTVSKQMCDKPIAPQFWPHDEVAGHWDRLILRSYIHDHGQRVLYQEGSVATMMLPAALIGRFAADGRLPDGTLMFGGTLAVKGGIRPSGRFEFELEDPVRGRKIGHGYSIETLPVVG